jgi:hypothetical protein
VLTRPGRKRGILQSGCLSNSNNTILGNENGAVEEDLAGGVEG